MAVKCYEIISFKRKMEARNGANFCIKMAKIASK